MNYTKLITQNSTSAPNISIKTLNSYTVTDPSVIAQELIRDTSILEYSADIVFTKPSAIPVVYAYPTNISTSNEDHIAATYTVNLIATYSDVLQLEDWFVSTLPVYRNSLKDQSVSTTNDALNVQEQAALIALVGSTLSFGDVYNAYIGNTLLQSQILTAWNRAQFGYNGDLASLLYFNLDRTFTTYIPLIKQNIERLVALSAYTITGSSSGSTIDQLSSLSNYMESSTYNVNSEVLSGYTKLQDTLSAQTSEIDYLINNVVNAINNQQNLPLQATTLLTSLGVAVNQSNSTYSNSTYSNSNYSNSNYSNSNSSISINDLISVLSGLRTLFELTNAANWLSFSGLQARLDNLIQNLILDLVGEAAGAFSHVQAMICAPLISIIRDISQAFGGKITPEIDSAMNSFVVLIESVTGKFEQVILDMYRHSWLHNDLVNSQITSGTTNSNLRNLVKTFDLLISALQSASYSNAIRIVSGDLAMNVAQKIVLPITKQLSIIKPSPSATLSDAIAKTRTYGVTIKGTPIQVSKIILANIQDR